MQYRLNGILLARLAAVLLAVGVATAATRNMPPLYSENPNARVYGQNRDDEVILNYRLPNNTEPVHYDVQLSTSVHTGEKAFTGTVKIDLKVTEETRTIVVHARQLKDFVATIKSKDDPAAVAQAMTFSYEMEREFLSLTPNNAQTSFAKDTNWELTIQYNGELRTDNGGFYLSTYTDENKSVRYLATTQFESTDARHAFPCYDEPAKRATFTITMTHSPTYRAISNMPVDATKSSEGVTAFLTTPKMSTYLVAFIVSDFVWSEGILNNLTQRIYSRPGTQNEQEWALVSGMLITQRLAEYYGVDFMLPKLDQVAVPDFAAGAMENWGLATYREEYMLYNKETSTVNTQTNIANIIAHEYCHQWFGNLVAIKWWTYLWLKEGFATLFSYQAVEDAYPEWGIFQQFHTDDYQRALTSDASNAPRPMTHYVQKPGEISRLYDSVSYSKAGSVLHMWQHALTNRVFQRGLHNYLTGNEYDSAVEGDLFVAIGNAAKDENYAIKDTIQNMMGSWTQQGGYPMLTVTRQYDSGAFSVKQEAFFNDANHKESKTWFVPFNYAVQSNPDFRNTTATHYLLNVAELSVADAKVSKDDWLILNKQSTGYYRINYDEQNWNLIIAGLRTKSHKIHPRNRAQLMHDSYRFSTTGHLAHSVLLDLMTYLQSEDQYAPWSTANGIITTFNRYLSGDKDYEDFKYFVSELVSEIYDKLGVNDIPGEQHYQKYTRSVTINIACLAGIESCLQETNNKLKDLVNGGIEIEPNLQSQTFCNGLRQSEDQEFNFVYNKLMSSEDQAQRRTLISSLGCAQKDAHIKKFIESSIDQTNDLRTQERTTLLSAAYSRGEAGLNACIDFLNGNWEAYADLTSGFGGSNPLDDDIRSMSQYVVNTEQQNKLNELVNKVKDSPKVTSSLEADVAMSIKSNFDWLSRNRDELMTWMSKYRFGNKSGSASLTASLTTMATALMLLAMRLF